MSEDGFNYSTKAFTSDKDSLFGAHKASRVEKECQEIFFSGIYKNDINEVAYFKPLINSADSS